VRIEEAGSDISDLGGSKAGSVANRNRVKFEYVMGNFANFIFIIEDDLDRTATAGAVMIKYVFCCLCLKWLNCCKLTLYSFLKKMFIYELRLGFPKPGHKN
jgi:hypothetical protein